MNIKLLFSLVLFLSGGTAVWGHVKVSSIYQLQRINEQWAMDIIVQSGQLHQHTILLQPELNDTEYSSNPFRWAALNYLAKGIQLTSGKQKWSLQNGQISIGDREAYARFILPDILTELPDIFIQISCFTEVQKHVVNEIRINQDGNNNSFILTELDMGVAYNSQQKLFQNKTIEQT
ncbi:MAG: hypothetical protein AAFU67_16975, partial [Bacteroidota bacterium]